ISYTVFPGDLRLNLLTLKDAGHVRGDLEDRDARTTPHIEHFPSRRRAFKGQPKRSSDIVYAYKIAPLLTIFVYQRRCTIHVSRREDRHDSRIRIGKRLSWPEHIKQAQSCRMHTIGLSYHQTQPF